MKTPLVRIEKRGITASKISLNLKKMSGKGRPNEALATYSKKHRFLKRGKGKRKAG